MKYDGPCICKAAMRPKWILDDGPRVFVCRRCGRLVSGYGRRWVERQREMERGEQRRY